MPTGAKAAAAAVKLDRQAVAKLVEAMVERRGGPHREVAREPRAQNRLRPMDLKPVVRQGHSARPRRRHRLRRRHRGCGEKWRRGGVWRAVLGRRVRRMLPCCWVHHFSPLITAIRREP